MSGSSNPTRRIASSTLPASPEEARLDYVPNPRAGSLYLVRFAAPEFTSLCPVTGQPDFAHLVIDYAPDATIVESKSLKLFLGAAAFAQSFVLAAFMGGMALGAWACSRISGRWRDLLFAYAIIEALVGLAALAFHAVFNAATEYSFAHVIPAIGNDFVAMIKDSALVSTIAVQELLWRASKIGTRHFRTLETLLIAAVVYWLLTIVFSYFQEKLERRMARGDR